VKVEKDISDRIDAYEKIVFFQHYGMGLKAHFECLYLFLNLYFPMDGNQNFYFKREFFHMGNNAS
jgi:hypothetical protein